MLAEYYQFAEKHEKFMWLHWNMRDINYVFHALEHRARVLGLSPFLIREATRVDLARTLVDLFGDGYIGHPRLKRLVEKNNITNRDFLTGQEEADAFDAQDYVRLHLSTLRKVDVLANIIERTIDGGLKTNSRWNEIHGGWIPWSLAFIQDHWFVSAIGLVSAAAGLVQLIWEIV